MIRKEWNEHLQIAEWQPEHLQYRSKWACFYCRTAFVRFQSQQQAVRCPTCEAITSDMGYLFQPPPKHNKKAWAIVQLLAKHHIAYHRVGAVAFINAFITEYGKSPLKAVQKNIDLYLADKKQDVATHRV
ncbi:hypothetical protein [Pectobacterium parmentieri]|uniref:Uncharacterized protein n=1 Tax=Pectobacterium parmentieri TaxID=1905730 RepID=A0A8B3FK31_PECPM|nr:hypothetical protein [Pectobacterium parmentieri]ACX90170.1 hypothetical protein Pecwa_4478 [Pectobacterium parmentieri WPP163]AOR60971.1 hypothetical protein A8F97_19065 [Pectobacterium parmentieri]AYH07885.1 hypothetical protein C5E25_22340 [Pectobacterium parmentieri]AYH12357.1 hypothetical protein C5E24_23085 [Pectobacterium parmentieri]AYH16637.1 hypothetical protein C5E23_21955 [Pectobacterium parmentieri]